MFTRKDQLLKRTPRDGIGRKEYLELLYKEFYESKSLTGREQVLANLANFAYDPVNYEYIREIGIIDIFLENLYGNNTNIVKYSIGGLCNLSLDPENREYIIYNDGISKILKHLHSTNVEIVADTITTLQFLMTEETRDCICTNDNIHKLLRYESSDDARLKNLATIFIEDHCTREQIEICRSMYSALMRDVGITEL